MTGQIEGLIRYAQERQADRAVDPERVRAVLPARRRRHVRQHRLGMISAAAAVAVVATVPALVLGGGGDGSTATLPGEQPALHYTVYVYLEVDATADQKAAIEAALPSFNPMGDVEFENREEAWRELQERAKDFPDLLQGVNAENMPESFHFEPKDLVSDCTGYAKVTHMPGVKLVQVIQQHAGSLGGVNSYGVVVRCDGEYAEP